MAYVVASQPLVGVSTSRRKRFKVGPPRVTGLDPRVGSKSPEMTRRARGNGVVTDPVLAPSEQSRGHQLDRSIGALRQ